ncbi:MAG: hypothetical protein IT256_04350 [Chitinophagaceae bacterium]|nr:hypothetical protein [Chitinophagaceae bacterium]
MMSKFSEALLPATAARFSFGRLGFHLLRWALGLGLLLVLRPKAAAAKASAGYSCHPAQVGLWVQLLGFACRVAIVTDTRPHSPHSSH